MKIESTAESLTFPSASARDVLTEILRDGAQRLLTAAIEAEVAEFIDSRSHVAQRRRPSRRGAQRFSAPAQHPQRRGADRHKAAARA